MKYLILEIGRPYGSHRWEHRLYMPGDDQGQWFRELRVFETATNTPVTGERLPVADFPLTPQQYAQITWPQYFPGVKEDEDEGRQVPEGGS